MELLEKYNAVYVKCGRTHARVPTPTHTQTHTYTHLYTHTRARARADTRAHTHTCRCAADAKAALAAKDAEVAKKDGLLADRAKRIKELEEQVRSVGWGPDRRAGLQRLLMNGHHRLQSL